jgi:hypothetical protein
MILKEIYTPAATGYESPNTDQSIPKLHDVRKTRLTLSQINALRLMNDVRKFEEEQRLNDIQRQYGAKLEQ